MNSDHNRNKTLKMLKLLFLGMLRRTCNVYGDCLMNDLGLAPIALASPEKLIKLELNHDSSEESLAREFDRWFFAFYFYNSIKFHFLETEGAGFEPAEACTSLVFKTRAINHSTTPPTDDRIRREINIVLLVAFACFLGDFYSVKRKQ